MKQSDCMETLSDWLRRGVLRRPDRSGAAIWRSAVKLDVLVFECLAERTIALAQLRRSVDPDAGFDPLLEARMRAVLPACVAQGVTIITNMGAANPLAAGKAVLERRTGTRAVALSRGGGHGRRCAALDAGE
jgi:hypothetical protein